MKTFLITISVVLVLMIIARYYLKKQMKSLSNIESHQDIIILSDSDFQQQLKGKIVLVDFWADWCMPCKMMLPILNNLAEDLPEGYFVAKLDVQKNQIMPQKFGVKGIPTLILFKDGKEIDRFVGVKTKDFLKKKMVG